MMTVERVSLQMVQEEVKLFLEFYHEQHGDEEDFEFDVDQITQPMIEEMNAEITGFDVKTGSASSYVPKTIWSTLADEDIVDEDLEPKFIEWYEEQHA